MSTPPCPDYSQFDQENPLSSKLDANLATTASDTGLLLKRCHLKHKISPLAILYLFLRVEIAKTSVLQEKSFLNSNYSFLRRS